MNKLESLQLEVSTAVKNLRTAVQEIQEARNRFEETIAYYADLWDRVKEIRKALEIAVKVGIVNEIDTTDFDEFASYYEKRGVRTIPKWEEIQDGSAYERNGRVLRKIDDKLVEVCGTVVRYGTEEHRALMEKSGFAKYTCGTISQASYWTKRLITRGK